MLFRLELEEIEGRWIAHVRDLPGCFASADLRDDALAAAPQAVVDYWAWMRAHGETVPDEPVQAEADEVHRAWNSEPDCEVNAFFAADRPPLAADEIAVALRLLEWSRADLLVAVKGLTEDEMTRVLEGQRWPIRGVLNHVGGAEWWYLDRLGLAFPREEVPEEAFQRLEKVRLYFRRLLPTLAGNDAVTEGSRELWSPRKVLRRALWHERDHTNHILEIRRVLHD